MAQANDVMLSASEAPAFRAKRKQILRQRLRMTPGSMQSIQTIFKGNHEVVHALTLAFSE